MTLLSLLTLNTLIAVLTAAVVTDLRGHRIPNALTLPAICMGILLQSLATGWSGAGQAMAGVLAGLACFAPFYLGKGMGAGDVKLLAAVGAFLGPLHALQAAILALCAGALMAAAYLAWQAARAAMDSGLRTGWSTAGTAGWVAAGQARRHRLAFALPIAAGSLASAYAAGSLPGLS